MHGTGLGSGVSQGLGTRTSTGATTFSGSGFSTGGQPIVNEHYEKPVVITHQEGSQFETHP